MKIFKTVLNTPESGLTTQLLAKYYPLRLSSLLIKSTEGDTEDPNVYSKVQNVKPVPADFILSKNKNYEFLLSKIPDETENIFVDDGHLLSRQNCDDLRMISLVKDVNVFVFGVRCNSKGKLFEGSKRLIEVSEKVMVMKNLCQGCCENEKGGFYVEEGSVCDVSERKFSYKSVCFDCKENEIN